MPAQEPVATRPTPRTRRLLFAAGCVVACVVTVIFLTVGDGVSASPATGPRGFLVDVGHTATWALLAAAFGVASVRGRWSGASQWLAVAALALYAAFLLAVFLG